MAGPMLRHFSLNLLRRKSTSASEQVPYAFAVVDLYRQGATVSSAASIPAGGSPTPVTVADIGALAVGDTVTVGAVGAALTLHSIASRTSIMLTNGGSAAVPLSAGERLVPTTVSARPVAYSDPFAINPIGSTLVADGDGRVFAYINGTPFDYTVRRSPPP